MAENDVLWLEQQLRDMGASGNLRLRSERIWAKAKAVAAATAGADERRIVEAWLPMMSMRDLRPPSLSEQVHAILRGMRDMR